MGLSPLTPLLYSLLLVALILVGVPGQADAGIYPCGGCCYYGCGYYPCYPDISLPPYFATHPPVYYGLPGVWPYGEGPTKSAPSRPKRRILIRPSSSRPICRRCGSLTPM